MLQNCPYCVDPTQTVRKKKGEVIRLFWHRRQRERTGINGRFRRKTFAVLPEEVDGEDQEPRVFLDLKGLEYRTEPGQSRLDGEGSGPGGCPEKRSVLSEDDFLYRTPGRLRSQEKGSFFLRRGDEKTSDGKSRFRDGAAWKGGAHDLGPGRRTVGKGQGRCDDSKANGRASRRDDERIVDRTGRNRCGMEFIRSRRKPETEVSSEVGSLFERVSRPGHVGHVQGCFRHQQGPAPEGAGHDNVVLVRSVQFRRTARRLRGQ